MTTYSGEERRTAVDEAKVIADLRRLLSFWAEGEGVSVSPCDHKWVPLLLEAEGVRNTREYVRFYKTLTVKCVGCGEEREIKEVTDEQVETT